VDELCYEKESTIGREKGYHMCACYLGGCQWVFKKYHQRCLLQLDVIRDTRAISVVSR
jgi:hypothetical protein